VTIFDSFVPSRLSDLRLALPAAEEQAPDNNPVVTQAVGLRPQINNLRYLHGDW
jgi:hypothetical protein